jgi:hypothetical protein
MVNMMSRLSRSAEAAAGRVAVSITLYGVCVAFLLAGLICLIVAAAVVIANTYGVAIAWLSVAVFCLVTGLVLLAVIALRHRRNRSRRRMAALNQSAGLGLAAQALPLMLRTSPIGTLLVVAAGAYLVAKAAQNRD